MSFILTKAPNIVNGLQIFCKLLDFMVMIPHVFNAKITEVSVHTDAESTVMGFDSAYTEWY